MMQYNPKFTPPPGAYGMCAVIYPDQLHWSVFYLLEEWKDRGQETLATARQLHQAASGQPTTSEGMGTSTVVETVSGIPPEDQPVIGSLCAVFSTLASENSRSAFLYGQALAALTGKNFFIVRAKDARDGVSTMFEPIEPMFMMMSVLKDGKTLYEAFGEKVNNDPSVLTIMDRITSAIENAPRSVKVKLFQRQKEMEREGRSDISELIRILKEVDPGIVKNVRH